MGLFGKALPYTTAVPDRYRRHIDCQNERLGKM